MKRLVSICALFAILLTSAVGIVSCTAGEQGPQGEQGLQGEHYCLRGSYTFTPRK